MFGNAGSRGVTGGALAPPRRHPARAARPAQAGKPRVVSPSFLGGLLGLEHGGPLLGRLATGLGVGQRLLRGIQCSAQLANLLGLLLDLEPRCRQINPRALGRLLLPLHLLGQAGDLLGALVGRGLRLVALSGQYGDLLCQLVTLDFQLLASAGQTRAAS